jgi:Flp pilus assembly protein TadG
MILALARWTKRVSRLFARKKDGVASVEFTLIAPLLIFMYFGVLELSDAMLAHRKVGSAVNMMADLVSREATTLEHAELESMYVAINKVIEPYGIDTAKMWVASIGMDADENPIVMWSIEADWSGEATVLTEKFTRGSEFSAIPESEMDLSGEIALLEPGSTLIVSHIEYPFMSSFSNMIVSDSMTFTRYAVRWPRYVTEIEYCDAGGTCS